MKAATVLGAGELGTACALALAANGVSAVRVLTRDAALASSPATPPAASSSAAATQSNWPPAIRFCSAGSRPSREGSAQAEGAEGGAALFVCTPITSYLPAEDAWAKAALGSEHSPVTHSLLTQWRHTWLPPSPSPPPSRHAALPFVCTFTRGFAADGAVAAQLADDALNNPHHPSPAEPAAALSAVPVLVAAGPILAKEWAGQCTPLSSGPCTTDGHSAGHSGARLPTPPRPRSALAAADAHKDSEAPSPRAAPAHPFPHAFSGAALTFATWTPAISADAGALDALAQQLRDCFARESVTFLREPDAAAVLSIVNGCVPLCSFGAGLVSAVYTGASVTALAAYAQHAAAATERLTNDLLGRPAGTPLPTAALSTLHCACTSLASREFALGRQLDFYFRKQDAVQAVFRGRSHHLFAATVDGLHSRMQAGKVASPFFEVLMDASNTLIRASRAGEGLVKAGYYDYSGTMDAAAGEGDMLRHAMQVDEAMLSGDEDRFTAAKERLMKAFPNAVIQ